MTYLEFLNELKGYAEKDFTLFQKKLILTKQHILGIRTPILRKIAKKYQQNLEEIFAYPDEYYEVTFIKLTIVSSLPYEKFIHYVERCVALMDNWASCDSFKAKCISKNREAFLKIIDRLFHTEKEFFQRYVLVVFLTEYVEEKYLPTIERYLSQANAQYYYVHMAVAWLTAEILIKYYENGINILKKGILPTKTHNKAIQKAIESYRLSKEQKDFLKSLKIKNEKL